MSTHVSRTFLDIIGRGKLQVQTVCDVWSVPDRMKTKHETKEDNKIQKSRNEIVGQLSKTIYIVDFLVLMKTYMNVYGECK